MVTKGVASVPSPVKNLSELAKSGSLIDHEQFVRVVADEFATQYGVEREIKVSSRRVCENDGADLKSRTAGGRFRGRDK